MTRDEKIIRNKVGVLELAKQRGSVRLFHSAVPPSAVPTRARGTAISTVPNEPVIRRWR